jgi:Golgi phosphoprotein 3 (GPP34)
MLTLAEETTLLLYGAVRKPDGTRTYDVFGRYGSSGLLVAGAILMDLALRGRVRMERPQSPEQRFQSQRLNMIWLLLAVVALLGPLAALLLNLLSAPVGVALSIAGTVLLIVVGRLANNRRAGKMAIADASPTGDELLDAALQGMARIGQRALIKTYIWRYFRIRTLAGDLAKLRARLEAEGLVSNAGRGPILFGMVEVKIVNRDHPAFRSLGERVRTVILGGVPDPQAVALACLFAGAPRGIVLGQGIVGVPRGVVLGRRGCRALNGLFQFFHDDEFTTVTSRLAQIRRGDPAITALIGNDLYDTFVAITYALQDFQAENTSSG